jgi:CDP-6-deoxy-D-xylo-4-hexulose-3-dehydrase
MEGAFGIRQFEKFENYLATRKRNAAFLTEHLQRYNAYLQLPVCTDNAEISWFFYPLLVKENAPFSAQELMSFLENSGIETRPIMSGDYTKHPVAKLYQYSVCGDLKNTRFIHKSGFIIGVHAGIGEAERSHIVASFERFFQRYR